MTWIPSVEYVLALFEKVMGKPVLMRRGNLKSTLDKVRFGIPFHDTPTIWDQVTILFREIVEYHYFHDGNKRIGILLAFIFLEKNGYEFNPPAGEVFSKTMDVSQGLLQFEKIKSWFIENSREKLF